MDDATRHMHILMSLHRSLPSRIERLTKDRNEIRTTLDRVEYMLSKAKDELTATKWALERLKAETGYDYTRFINVEEEKEDE